jgi:hypothetical protein
MATMDEANDSLVRIPGLNGGERAVVESLLQAGGIFYVSSPGDYKFAGPRLLVRASDLAEVKELLADFRIQTPNGELVPISWSLS